MGSTLLANIPDPAKAFSRERGRRRGGKRRIYKTGKPFGTAQKMKFANLVSNYNRRG